MTIRPRPHLATIPPCPHGSFSAKEGEARGIDTGDVIDFSASCNPLGASPQVLDAMRSVDPSHYPDDEARELRAALGQAIGVDPPWIIAGNGSVELIYHLASAFLREGDRAVVFGPTFGEYERACRVAGGQVIEVRAREEDDFRLDLERAAGAIRRAKPKLAFLCNPNNPTGQLLTAPEIEGLLDACEETLLVVDEAYLPFCDASVYLRPYLSTGRLLLLRSMTKDHGLAGIRLGYAVAPPELLDGVRRVRPPWTVSAAAQAAGLAAVRDTGHLDRARRIVQESRAYLVAELSRLGLGVVPSSANLLMVRVGNGAAFRSALLSRGICVRDCASFGLPAYVRIGVRRPEECARLVESAREVLAGV